MAAALGPIASAGNTTLADGVAGSKLEPNWMAPSCVPSGSALISRSMAWTRRRFESEPVIEPESSMIASTFLTGVQAAARAPTTCPDEGPRAAATIAAPTMRPGVRSFGMPQPIRRSRRRSTLDLPDDPALESRGAQTRLPHRPRRARTPARERRRQAGLLQPHRDPGCADRGRQADAGRPQVRTRRRPRPLPRRHERRQDRRGVHGRQRRHRRRHALRRAARPRGRLERRTRALPPGLLRGRGGPQPPLVRDPPAALPQVRRQLLPELVPTPALHVDRRSLQARTGEEARARAEALLQSLITLPSAGPPGAPG